MKTKLINNATFRLIYSFYINDSFNNFDELYNDKNYKIHFLCMNECITNQFDEVCFILSTKNKNEQLIKDIKIYLCKIFEHTKKISFILESDDQYNREGKIFNDYIIKKLDIYDGITLFFHNKRVQPTYNLNIVKEDITYWIIGQYYFLMRHYKEWFGSFIRSDKLIYGWPYTCDNYHPQWLISGNCFIMKCKEIEKYINDNKLENKVITERCIGEYIFPEILDKSLIDYPNSDKIKDYSYVSYYEPSENTLFNEYLKETMIYNTYVKFISYCNAIINLLNN